MADPWSGRQDPTIATLVDEELKRSLDHAAEGLHWVGPDGTILWANQTELDMLGYAADEYIGHNIREFHVDPTVIADILARLGRRETLLSYDARLRHRDGSIRHVQINSNVRWQDERFLHTCCFTRDVTGSRYANELATRLASIVEYSEDAIYSQDQGGCVTSWNPAAERMFGYSAAEAMGCSLRQLIIPRDRWAEEDDIVARVFRGERIPPYETVRVRKDGGAIDVALSASAIGDAAGATVGVSKLARDITTRKRLEAEDAFLVGLDDTLRPLTEAPAITYTAASRLGEHLQVNRCAYAIVSDDQDSFELTGNFTDGVSSIVGRYTFRQFGEEWRRLMQAGEPYVVVDAEADPRLGPERPAYAAIAIRAVICVPIMKQGRFVAAMAVHSATPRVWTQREVALVQRVASRCWESIERARVTEHLRESEQQFRDLANSIANLAWMARPDGWIYWYNDQWYAYTGTTPEQMAGWGWERVHDPACLSDVKQRWQQSIISGKPFEMVFPIRGADGQFRRFLTRVNAVCDSDGRVVRWFGTNTDVEAERRATEANERLREREQAARRAAEGANRAKDEFLAMLGHELRNPLAPILTALQLMKLRGSDETGREQVVIERQVRHLTRLVDDLLDVSRIARGKVDLRQEVVELADIVARAIEMTSPLLEERQHALQVDVPRHGLTVTGDATRLSQVVANLLTNAAKYTGQGGDISVLAGAEGSELVLRVCDNGIGIAPDVLPHIFDLFVQERQALDRAQGGLGLGLTIVRSLVERHGGRVVASSDGVGKGAEFTIRLPKAVGVSAPASPVAARVPGPARDTAARRPVRVLVVDDNADAADMMVRALVAHGYPAHTAYDGPQALDLARDVKPQVAFIDIGLPVMDGYELAQCLRDHPELRGVRLIAVTGYGQRSDRERALAAGFEAHLVKPVEWDAIIDLLQVEPSPNQPA